jgi:flagellar hook assembly protein FlgD
MSLMVFNVGGRAVRTLVSRKESPGLHQVLWDGRDEMGKDVGPGVYLCRLEAGPHSAVHKLADLK